MVFWKALSSAKPPCHLVKGADRAEGEGGGFRTARHIQKTIQAILQHARLVDAEKPDVETHIHQLGFCVT